MHRLPTQGQCNPQRLTGLERQEQAPGLVVGAPDHVHDADADGHRSGNVDQLELFARHLGRRSLAEPQAAQPEAGPAEQQAQEVPVAASAAG